MEPLLFDDQPAGGGVRWSGRNISSTGVKNPEASLWGENDDCTDLKSWLLPDEYLIVFTEKVTLRTICCLWRGSVPSCCCTSCCLLSLAFEINVGLWNSYCWKNQFKYLFSLFYFRKKQNWKLVQIKSRRMGHFVVNLNICSNKWNKIKKCCWFHLI